MKTKTFRGPIEIKDDGQTGEFRAVFSTFNVIDLDGDVTVPGAFTDGENVRIAYWGHRWQDLPVGKGVIHADDEKAWVDGRFFLDTEAGKETYLTVKNLGELQEWSYGFDVEESSLGQFEDEDVQFLRRLTVHEVSPVMLGAGIGTHTESIKGRKAALASHSTPTTDAEWDGPANEARARSGEDEAYYRRIYAWRNPDGEPGVKSTYKFVHHMVDGDGNPGAANIRACQTGIGVLNGGRGGTTIPDGDRRGVWNHLARHLRDADVEPPELKALDSTVAGAADGARNNEGQTINGEPSGVSPRVVSAQVEILQLEE